MTITFNVIKQGLSLHLQKFLKILLWKLPGYIVAMVTCNVNKTTITCPPMIWYCFTLLLLYRLIKSGSTDPSNWRAAKCWRPGEAYQQSIYVTRDLYFREWNEHSNSSLQCPAFEFLWTSFRKDAISEKKIQNTWETIVILEIMQ